MPTALSITAGTLPFSLFFAGFSLAQGAERVLLERPPTATARGLFATSSLVVIALGATLVIVTAVYLIRQARRR